MYDPREVRRYDHREQTDHDRDPGAHVTDFVPWWCTPRRPKTKECAKSARNPIRPIMAYSDQLCLLSPTPGHGALSVGEEGCDVGDIKIGLLASLLIHALSLLSKPSDNPIYQSSVHSEDMSSSVLTTRWFYRHGLTWKAFDYKVSRQLERALVEKRSSVSFEDKLHFPGARVIVYLSDMRLSYLGKTVRVAYDVVEVY